jgi:hypothetical protein
MAGASWGRTTRRSDWSSVQPRSRAASSSSGRSPASRVRTITVTYTKENVTWPMTTVTGDSDQCRPLVNTRNSATAVAISGVTRVVSRMAPGGRAHRVRARTSPKANSVPNTVEATAVTAAISRLRRTDASRPELSKSPVYQRRLGWAKEFSDFFELNENTTTTITGTSRNSPTRAVIIHSTARPQANRARRRTGMVAEVTTSPPPADDATEATPRLQPAAPEPGRRPAERSARPPPAARPESAPG